MSDDAEEAMQRARAHLRQASLEGLEAARALLQVAMASSGLAEATPDSWIGRLQRSLEDLITALRDNTSFSLPGAIAEPLAAALDAEIKRWEARSRTDPDARFVLRAFLGLRELLWEIGMRHGNPPTHPRAAPNAGSGGPDRPKRERVQRFKVED